MTDIDEHTWRTRSSHRTSEGVLSYQKCSCGSWRLLLSAYRVADEHERRAGLARPT